MINGLISNTGLLLKNVQFKPGINIILGRYSGAEKPEGVNGIGKSSLVRLIDYCFLSDTAEKVFLQSKYDFLRKENHDVILDFNVGEKRYFIRRDFASKSRIEFGEDIHHLISYDKTELKSIFTDLFFVSTEDVFLSGNRFRTLMNFFIKDDINNQKRFEPINFLRYSSANEKEKTLYNFFLLNLPTRSILKFIELVDEYGKSNDRIKDIEAELEKETGKTIDAYRSEKLEIENKIALLERRVSDFEFMENYKNIEQDLIELTSKINTRLDEYHALNRKLYKIKESYEYSPEFDTKEIRKLYNEMQDNFGDMVAQSLEKVLAFKKEILENRNKYLMEKEQKLDTAIQAILVEISPLEKERTMLYNMLREKGALDSITNTYEQIVLEKTALERNAQRVKQIDEIQATLSEIEINIGKTKRDMRMELKACENLINSFRTLFMDILKHAIYLAENIEDSYFNISDTGVKQTQLPFKIEVRIPKAEALGQARLNIVAYDLMVFLSSLTQERRLPDFLIHDGVFHGISQKTRIDTINYVNRRFSEFSNVTPFQYIITFNEDEISMEGRYGRFDFDIKESVVAEYADTPGKMIFKRIIP